MPTIHGAILSPFVRKVRVTCALKSIETDLVSVFPGSDDPEFRKLSPLGKIPAYTEGDFFLSDSSVICTYLDKTHPLPTLFPEEPKVLAKALWYEEYADTEFFEKSTRIIFFPRVVVGKILKQAYNEEEVQTAIDNNLPRIFDYLESQLGASNYIVGEHLSIADIAIVSHLVNLGHAGEAVDPGRWPKLVRYSAYHLEQDYFNKVVAEEKAMIASFQ